VPDAFEGGVEFDMVFSSAEFDASFSGTVEIESTDPDEPIISIPLSASTAENLGAVELTVRIENDGPGRFQTPYHFNVVLPEGARYNDLAFSPDTNPLFTIEVCDKSPAPDGRDQVKCTNTTSRTKLRCFDAADYCSIAIHADIVEPSLSKGLQVSFCSPTFDPDTRNNSAELRNTGFRFGGGGSTRCD
jgi:hypothetical protein